MSKNDITGDTIATKPVSDLYRDNYDAIFGQKEEQQQDEDKGEKTDDRD